MLDGQAAIQVGTGIGSICKSTRHGDQLPAKRVSGGWLLSYLGDDDIAVVSSLSVFVGSFDAAGAAAVASATGAVLLPSMSGELLQRTALGLGPGC